MAIVLLYWTYLFLSTVSVGIACVSVCKIKEYNPFILPFIGGFGIAIIAGVWSIWGDLGSAFEMSLASSSLISIGIYRKNVLTYLFSLKAKITALPLFSKLLLGTLFVFALAQSASAPYVIDNESYYIQTIKWLDTYGFVPGLANLHYFLGQHSGWHILQSALNLNSISNVLNDINGFYLLLGNAYALDKLQRYFSSKHLIYLAVGFLPLFNIFFFQFISSPSPDLPIFLITAIVFTEFSIYYLPIEKESTPILLLFTLVVFAVFIKVIAIFLLPLPVLLYLKEKEILKKDVLKLGIVSFLALIVFVVKNSIISGYLLYPLSLFKQDADWTIPAQLQQYLVEATKSYAFFITPDKYEQMTFGNRIIHWLRLPKLHGLFNKAILALLVVFPILFRKKLLKTPYLALYIITGLQLIFLWLSSPQYRFFFGFLVVLSCLILAYFIKQKKHINLLLGISTIAITVPLFMNFSLKQLSNNQFNQDLSSFSTLNIINPHPITKYSNAQYEKRSLGNLHYYTPTNIDFFWATGDCKLPCIQEQQLHGFKEYFELAPQLRSTDLKDGFKSVYFPNE